MYAIEGGTCFDIYVGEDDCKPAKCAGLIATLARRVAARIKTNRSIAPVGPSPSRSRRGSKKLLVHVSAHWLTVSRQAC